jgi:hypothetical protein
MITINSAQSNTVILYLDSTKQYFLFEFVSGLACGNIYIIPENVSTCADYQKFVINHDFGFGGVWTLNVYEQTSPVNTNPANATFLMTDLVKIVVDETCFNTPPIITNPCPDINPIDFSCEDLLTPYTGLTTEQINCVLASLTCDYLKDNLTYEQIACFGPPLSDYSCAQLLEGLIESQLSCLLRSFDCDFLNDPYLGLTTEQLACLPYKPIELYTCGELIDPYNGLTDDQKTCVLQSLSCEFLNNQYTGLTDEQRECVGKPIEEYTCEQLIDPYTGLSDNQKSCVLQALPCGFINDRYNGLTDEQRSCIIQDATCEELTDPYLGLTEEQNICVLQNLSCDFLETNLTAEQLECIILQQYDPDYRNVLNYATAQGFTTVSNFQKVLQSDYMANLKAATANGISDFELIRVYGNDLVHGVIPANLGFDGINWSSPGTLIPTRVNTLTKTINQGYSGNGVDGRIREAFNPNTSAIPTDDFLWFALYYYEGFAPVGFAESVFDSTFNKRIDMFFILNSLSITVQYLFNINTGVQTYATANSEPAFQRLIMWRSGNDIYIMVNGTQYGPFSNGSDTGKMNQEFNSFCRAYQTNNFFDFMGSNTRKTTFGFGKASNINKPLLDAALAAYQVNL